MNLPVRCRDLTRRVQVNAGIERTPVGSEFVEAEDEVHTVVRGHRATAFQNGATSG